MRQRGLHLCVDSPAANAHEAFDIEGLLHHQFCIRASVSPGERPMLDAQSDIRFLKSSLFTSTKSSMISSRSSVLFCRLDTYPLTMGSLAIDSASEDLENSANKR